ncbi:MAG: hypothetical protein II837_06905 [Treponema sp.]|nr:hypothetical protein [Treponema sp.]
MMRIVDKFWALFFFGMACIPFAVWKWVEIVILIVRRVCALFSGGGK